MNLRLLLGYAAPYRNILCLCMLLSLAQSMVALCVPWLGGRFADSVLTSAAAGASPVLLALLGTFIGRTVLNFAGTMLLGRASVRILADLRVRVYDHLQALPLAFFQQRRHGDVMTLMTSEVKKLAGYITGTLLSLVPAVVTAGGAIWLMGRVDSLLALLAAVLVPLFYFLIKVMSRGLQPLAKKLQEANASAMAIADENMAMLPAIKTFTRETEESERYRVQIAQVNVLSTREYSINAALEPALELLAGGTVVLLLWVASMRIAEGRLDPADLVTVMLYAALLTGPISTLSHAYGRTQSVRGSLDRLQAVMSERPEQLFLAGAVLPPVQGAIEFAHVHFAYPGRPPALRGLDLRIDAGETVAITGENGAGKSTLAHLLLRLHEPDAGRILVDGIDIATVGIRSLRRQIGIVPQHVMLFNGTVRDNIGYGRGDASTADIERAARLGQAHEFILALPEGYDTLIGDHGVRLSGGQRQRIALARALLKDPPILILDEATAMFDPEGEKAFIGACEQAFAHRTVILITHRPASLALADRVIRIEAQRAHTQEPQPAG